jgi:hypothetical protein
MQDVCSRRRPAFSRKLAIRSFGRPEIGAGAGFRAAPSEGVAKPEIPNAVILREPLG